MNLGKSFHIGALIVGAVAQGMMDPAAEYGQWSAALVKLLHAGVATLQVIFGILAVNWAPGPLPAIPNDAGKLDNLKDIR